jgi:predicted PurR-regulated permease PerM
MKHFVLLLIAGLMLYGVWQIARPLLRRYVGPTMTRHLLRLLVFVLVLLGLLLVAYYFPPIHLL